jgi:D-alanine-D-alanine ligase
MSSTTTKTIAVLAGGYSGEAVISIQSAATVMEHLDRDLYSPLIVRIDKNRWWVDLGDGESSDIDRTDFSWRCSMGEKQYFDAIFIMVHGTPGEDGILQEYFEGLELPFTTGSAESVTGTFNKFSTTNKLRDAGFSVGDAVLVDSSEVVGDELIGRVLSEVGMPCFVKPNKGGSSLGISRVDEIEGLGAAIELAKSTSCESIIIEELLQGREYSLGVVPGKDGKPEALPLTEIITDNVFFDYNAKYEGASQEITPADLSTENAGKIQEMAMEAYNLLGCRGLVRIDFILVGDEPAILEVNGVPGFSKMSILPQQLESAGISIKEQLTRVLKSISV